MARTTNTAGGALWYYVLLVAGGSKRDRTADVKRDITGDLPAKNMVGIKKDFCLVGWRRQKEKSIRVS